jgi:hypothetical protein
MFAGHGLQFTVNLAYRLAWWIPLNWPLSSIFSVKSTIFARPNDLKWKTRFIGNKCAKSDLQNGDLRATG